MPQVLVGSTDPAVRQTNDYLYDNKKNNNEQDPLHWQVEDRYVK